jgi:tetratricopeptide (TPR) repeat protein
MMPTIGTVVLMVSSILASRTAWAGRFDVKERAARKACLTGDFAKGIDILADLFLKTNDFAYIFNQGRCFEQNHRYEDAIARFREFLVKDSTATSEERADAEKHIAACEAYLGRPKTEPPIAVRSPEPIPIPSRPAETAPLAKVPPGTVEVASPPEGKDSGRGLRVGAVIVASLGAASVVTGIVLNVKVNNMTSDLEKPYSYSRSTNSTRETYKTVGWIAYGLGGAALAAGAVAYGLGWSRGRSDSATLGVAFIPEVAPGLAALNLGGTF